MTSSGASTPPPAADSSASALAALGFQKIAELSELEPHGQFSKWVGNHDVLVYRFEGRLMAVSNICPHFGGPVGFHKMKERKFVCLWHNYEFAAKDGSCLTNRHLNLREYRLRQVGDEIWVRLVEPPEGIREIKP